MARPLLTHEAAAPNGRSGEHVTDQNTSKSVSATMLEEPSRRCIWQRAGPTPDATGIATSVLVTWQQVARRLAPVIGVRGANVLFARALHLASVTFPWLPGDDEPAERLEAILRARLEAQPVAIAFEAGCTVLQILTQLLSDLIGEPLSERLLTPVWAASLPAEPEHTP